MSTSVRPRALVRALFTAVWKRAVKLMLCGCEAVRRIKMASPPITAMTSRR